MPTHKYKVLSVEVDGVDLDAQTELALSGINVFFDKTGSSLSSDDTDSAIKEVAALASSGFSYYYIDGLVVIPRYREMITSQRITIAAGGRLVNHGRVRIL